MNNSPNRRFWLARFYDDLGDLLRFTRLYGTEAEVVDLAVQGMGSAHRADLDPR